jgi:23S rRNA (cytidine1920-2'-O)/16S rRNA (cytidine1409-2'-O)-methyltransferase
MAFKDTSDHKRLDNLLVELGHFPSRSRARDAINRGTVSVDGNAVTKASLGVHPDAAILIDDPAQNYVSRAALKLVAALDVFEISAKDLICLDVGASTGGFTQVLLERDAKHIIALDVGHDQLDDRFRQNDKVTVLEGVNARDLDEAQLGGWSPHLIVSDVSFISLKLALPPALSLAADGAICILLVKPQFEVGRENVGKGGIVRPEDGEAAANDLKNWLDTQDGWRSTGLIPSPISGGDGNLEYLLAGCKDG